MGNVRDRENHARALIGSLGLYATADNYAAGRWTLDDVKQHVYGYCWKRRDDAWRARARRVLAQIEEADRG